MHRGKVYLGAGGSWQSQHQPGDPRGCSGQDRSLALLALSWVAGTIPERGVVIGVSLGMWGQWPQLHIPTPAPAVLDT